MCKVDIKKISNTSDDQNCPAWRGYCGLIGTRAAYNAALPAPENLMKPFGTPHSDHALRVLLLGAGELGKEVAIELQRYAVEVIAVDRYANAPAMQIAHRSHVIDMLDGNALRAVIELEKPDLVVPEIEAIHTPTLIELEKEGQRVIPTARAVWLTMDREGIRKLAAEELKLPTSLYRFCDSETQYREAAAAIGYPFVIKPVMSSSGKGQSVVRNPDELQHAWDYAQSGGRAGKGRVIVEGFVDFDYEITMLTVRHTDGVSFCAPIGHRQEDGDYRESWQPQPMSDAALAEAQRQAAAVTGALGGWGVFGVEFFVKGDAVIFSEVSPRPHDTGLVTLISQELSEFALHARAILGLPIPVIHQYGPSASCAVLVEGDGAGPRYHGVATALAESDTQLRIFGKPEVKGRRRMAVTLARADTLEAAVGKAVRAAGHLRIEL
jgi:phosphoribosylglycinamide formyltransferase 2